MSGRRGARFQLPAAEDDLWHQVVVRLLEQRDSSEVHAQDQLRLLEELAFHNRFCGKPLTQTFTEQTATWLAEELRFSSPRHQALSWLEDLERWELVSRHQSGAASSYEFAISTLDEYFAARHWAGRWAEGDKRFERWIRASTSRLPWKPGLDCPNPHCGARLPPLHSILEQAGVADVIVMAAGMLQEEDKEAALLNQLAGSWYPLYGLTVDGTCGCGTCLGPLLLIGAGWKALLYVVALLPRPANVPDRVVLSILVAWGAFLGAVVAMGLGGLLFSLVFSVLPHGLTMRSGRILGYKWKVLSRCRRAHPDIVQGMMAITLRALDNLDVSERNILDEGLLEITVARVPDNFERFFRGCMQALSDSNDLAGRGAVIALGQMRLNIAVEPLIEELQKYDFGRKSKAAIALGNIGDARAIEPLILAMQTECLTHYEFFGEAAEALWKFDKDRAVDTVLPWTYDEKPLVRGVAAKAFGSIRHPRTAAALRWLLTDPDAYVRAAAEGAIDQMKIETIPVHSAPLE